MLTFDGEVQELVILDEGGKAIMADDHEKRFFEASWMHKRGSIYYISYSTGDTHLIVYATGTSPLGPFTYAGKVLTPPIGWTTHHSTVEHEGKWWLFYHYCQLSGKDHLRSTKVQELKYDDDEGRIITMDP